jgi:hypothetical protein
MYAQRKQKTGEERADEMQVFVISHISLNTKNKGGFHKATPSALRSSYKHLTLTSIMNKLLKDFQQFWMYRRISYKENFTFVLTTRPSVRVKNYSSYTTH